MKYAWVAKNKAVWPVTMTCEALGVSTSGYFEHQRRHKTSQPSKPGGGRLSNEALLARIRAVHAEVKGEYGWPRVWKELLARGIRAGKDRVQRLMRLHGIKARGKRKFVVTTDSRHDLPVAPNLLARDFTPSEPDRVRSSDITYIATDEGWLYLAAVIDLLSRQVVGWSMQPHMQASLVTDALRMAWFRRHPAPGLIFHSDRGSQYCSQSFQAALSSYGIRSSMSRKGNCSDNAPTKSLWGSLKVGRLYGKQFATQRQAMDEVIDWLTFYNHRRLHSTLGYVSPMRFEENWHARQSKKSACSSGYGLRRSSASSLARKSKSVYLICTEDGGCYTEDGIASMMRRHVVESGVVDFATYDCKAKGATDLYEQGVPLVQISALCAHDSVRTTEIYIKQHLFVVMKPNEREIKAG